jgi:hypothetical protein
VSDGERHWPQLDYNRSMFTFVHCFGCFCSTALRDKLEANTKRFRTAMSGAGFDLGGSKDHPIIPIMLGYRSSCCGVHRGQEEVDQVSCDRTRKLPLPSTMSS